jgi:serine/threonine protein kinase
MQVLWEGTERVFCKLLRKNAEGHRHAFIPLPSGGEHPTLESINRLAQEYGLKEYLDAAWALRPLELVREPEQTMLVVEYAGGEPLDRLIGEPMETGLFLQLPVSMTGALGRLHGRGLIHKDIKPANVVVDSKAGRAWLTGFGIASRIPESGSAPNLPKFSRAHWRTWRPNRPDASIAPSTRGAISIHWASPSTKC